jgi:chromosome segregation ATPase
VEVESLQQEMAVSSPIGLQTQIRTLETEIEIQKSEIENLKRESGSLEERLDGLEERLAALPGRELLGKIYERDSEIGELTTMIARLEGDQSRLKEEKLKLKGSSPEDLRARLAKTKERFEKAKQEEAELIEREQMEESEEEVILVDCSTEVVALMEGEAGETAGVDGALCP